MGEQHRFFPRRCFCAARYRPTSKGVLRCAGIARGPMMQLPRREACCEARVRHRRAGTATLAALVLLTLIGSARTQQGGTGPSVAVAPPADRASAWHEGIYKQVQQHKSAFPPDTLSAGQSATTVVSFSLDRQGRLVESAIIHGSGFPALDQAALETLKRAQPFTPSPAELPGETFKFTLPIRFNMSPPPAR